MKKFLPIFLFLIFAALVVVSIVALSHYQVSAETSESDALQAKSNMTPDENYGSLAPTDIFDVSIPDSLPNFIKDYEGFRVAFNKNNHTPNYVAWELLGSETFGKESRAKTFWTDSEVTGCAETSDYTRSGFDRGHLCPAADQKWSSEAMRDCFSLANIAPQDGALNRGAWQTLESKERLWAQRDSAIIIVAGPIYDPMDNRRIGESGVRVPGAFFKVLLALHVKSPRAIAFVYPNMMAPGNMEQYAMSVDQLESITGYDFFHALPDSIENILESAASFKEWNRR